MRWTPLPRGRFTGTDWSQPGATDGCDPYLAWAEADGFAGYGRSGPPRWLPLLIELVPGATIAQLHEASAPEWLHIPPAYTGDGALPGLRHCTARVRPAFFRKLREGGPLRRLIHRFELGLPAGEHADDPNRPLGGRTRRAEELLRGKVLGVIDGGLAFAHQNFLRAGGTRIRHFWRQDRLGRGPAPAEFGYGHALDAATIDEAIRRNSFDGLVDETRIYQQFRMGVEMDKRINHGTHVLDIACGPRRVEAGIAGMPPSPDAPPSWRRADDDASRCELIAVQLDWDTVLDTSGGSMNVHILDALLYILARCHPSAAVVVNLSWGTLAGPHDGSSILETAMDELIRLSRGRLQIVLPAGNGYQARTHANVTLKPGGERTLHWHCPAQDPTQNFVELWLPDGAEDVALQIAPPGRPALPPIEFGGSGMWCDDAGRPLCALIYPRRVATGERGTCALLAVSPSVSFASSRALAPSGVWQIRLLNRGRKSITVDAYIERDDEVIGVRTGARQSHFEDRHYDTSGDPGAFVDHPSNPTPIRRSGTFNSIATGSATVSVGGVRVRGPTWSHYSPQRPDPDAARPKRPGVVKTPGQQAPSDENGVLLGLRAASTRSGGTARLVGTSDSAPQWARTLLNRARWPRG